MDNTRDHSPIVPTPGPTAVSAERAGRGRPGRPSSKRAAALGQHVGKPAGSSQSAASAQERPGPLRSSLRKESLAQSGPGGDKVQTVQFCNIQEIFLPAGFSEFRLRNPELTNGTAVRVYKVPERSEDHELVESVEIRGGALEASPRLEASDKKGDGRCN